VVAGLGYSEIFDQKPMDFFRRPWAIALLGIILIQAIALVLGPRDLDLLRVGQSPFYSSTLGVVIFDGGSAEYWGMGYTIFYHLEPYRYRTPDRQMAHADLWYWLPFLNFPLPKSEFIDRVEVAKMREKAVGIHH
jgi:hypothetical protein